jgi:hypothetical protein
VTFFNDARQCLVGIRLHSLILSGLNSCNNNDISSGMLAGTQRGLSGAVRLDCYSGSGGCQDFHAQGGLRFIRTVESINPRKVGELVHSRFPVVSSTPPISSDVTQCRPDELGGSPIGREMSSGLDDLAQLQVDVLDSVRSVYSRDGDSSHRPVLARLAPSCFDRHRTAAELLEQLGRNRRQVYRFGFRFARYIVSFGASYALNTKFLTGTLKLQPERTICR